MNKDAAEKRTRNNKGRLPVTMNVMLLLKKMIRTWERLMLEKLLVWAFGGSFIIHELLCNAENQFDTDKTLLTEDIVEQQDNKGNSLC
jgi:hypothetical protein